MLKARDIMNPKPAYCQMDAPLAEIARRFAEEDLSGLLVLDDDKRLLGVITDSDLIDQQANLHLPTALAVFDMVIPLGEERFEEEINRMQAMTAEDLVNPSVKSVQPDASLNDIATIMSDVQVHHLPVLEGDTVIGVISKHDVISALAQRSAG
jgi:CBS domain-containing protein